MKRIAAFAVGFLAVAIPAVHYLARQDREPDMAGLALLMFGFIAFLASVGVFLWSAFRTHTRHGVILATCAGVVSAAIFYAALGITTSRLGLATSLGLSFGLALLVAWLSPLLPRASA